MRSKNYICISIHFFERFAATFVPGEIIESLKLQMINNRRQLSAERWSSSSMW